MLHFTAAIAHRHLDLVAFLKKARQCAQLGLVIAVLGRRPELDLLDLDLLLLLARRLLGLVLLVKVLAVIHDLADGRLCIGGNLHQIQPGRFCACQRFHPGENPDLLAIFSDNSQTRRGDFFVAPILTF
jgi:hypothetical protein